MEASLRLDAVASAGFRMSRAKAADLVKAGDIRRASANLGIMRYIQTEHVHAHRRTLFVAARVGAVLARYTGIQRGVLSISSGAGDEAVWFACAG